MYNCNSPKVVYDPYQVLPPYGENEIEIHYADGKLSLKVTFNDEDTGEDKNLNIEFEFPVFHRFESFPGVDGMNIEYDDFATLGSLELLLVDNQVVMQMSTNWNRMNFAYFLFISPETGFCLFKRYYSEIVKNCNSLIVNRKQLY